MKTAVLIAIIAVTIMAAFHQATAGRKGVCFMKYSKKAGCRKMGKFARKKVSFEDCCKSKGQGWSERKKNRKTCTPCVEVKVITSYWSSWGSWSKCSKTCGIGKERRRRQCISRDTSTCTGKEMDSKKCRRPPCAVDGGWSSWTAWGPCSVTCGKGHQKQTRSCSNPKPQHGGKECQGSLENWRACLLQKHCPVDGGWGEWSTWGACSKTCDLGKKTRTRKCDSPIPKYGGKPCNTSEATGFEYCREERCGTTTEGCGENDEDCASGSGSGWQISSGSGSGFSGAGGSGGSGGSEASGGTSGEESSGEQDLVRPNPIDDEDFS